MYTSLEDGWNLKLKRTHIFEIKSENPLKVVRATVGDGINFLKLSHLKGSIVVPLIWAKISAIRIH